MQLNPFLELKVKWASYFRVILQGEFEYNQAREISNSLFDLKPLAIAYPRTTDDVQLCINYCRDRGQPFRIRSGGHHHEGMSSQNGGMVIRLSDMSMIEYCNKEKTEAWIDVGMKLGSVYDELAHFNRMIPAGGCFTVNVGGLALGGGWGMHSRKRGLTCDNVLEIEFVTADGEMSFANLDHNYKLFKAMLGAGQGNFGIVTRLKFRLSKIGENLTWFRFGWNADQREVVAREWLNIQAQFPKELTSFIRMTVTKPGDDKRKGDDPRSFSIYGGGLFYGTEKELKTLDGIRQLIEKTNPVEKNFKPVKKTKALGLTSASSAALTFSIADLFGYDDFTMKLTGATALLDAAPDCKMPAPPSANCNVPHPHKVSSAFPKGKGEEYNAKIAKAIAQYLDNSTYDPNVRSYMTFHAMGGEIDQAPSYQRTFAFEEKEFLLQFQSWWNYPEDQRSDQGKVCMDKIKEIEKAYVEWVKQFRANLAHQELVTGAFINFVDKDLPDFGKGKEGLLYHYFGNHLYDLQDLKQQHDPKNLFDFEMSIPLGPD